MLLQSQQSSKLLIAKKFKLGIEYRMQEANNELHLATSQNLNYFLEFFGERNIWTPGYRDKSSNRCETNFRKHIRATSWRFYTCERMPAITTIEES